jgi:hypothetical protein
MYKYTSELGADKLDTGLWCVLQPEKRENQNYGNIFKIRNCGTYFSELWELIKKNRNCGNISKKSKKIGIMGTYLYLKIRNCGNIFKKSELWEHIHISTIRNCGNIYNRNCGTCHSELWDPSPKTRQQLSDEWAVAWW